MKVAALILGILGGIAGVLGGLAALTVGGVRTILPDVAGLGIVALSFVTMGAGILGIIGGALAIGFPRTAGWLMLVSAVTGLIATTAAYVLAAILLVIGGILALTAGRREAYPPAAAPGGYSGGAPGVQH
jgi:hypothetical protein